MALELFQNSFSSSEEFLIEFFEKVFFNLRTYLLKWLWHKTIVSLPEQERK